MCPVWRCSEHVKSNTVQNISQLFLGVYKLAPLLAICGNMGWKPPNIINVRRFDWSTQQLTRKSILHDHAWNSEVESLSCMNDFIFNQF